MPRKQSFLAKLTANKQIQRTKPAATWLRASFSQYSFWYTLLVCLLYLLIFQWTFITTGDAWAEAFYEYVYGAVVSGWQGFFVTGIAGYFNFIPKILSYGYVLEGGPIQYVDYFFRFVTVAYTVASVSYIAHRHNRYLIQNDALRSILALLLLMTFYHISSFSFINVWYVGFLPILLVSLNPARFKNQWQEIAYATFAMSVCLTKPSLIVLPLVLYRIWRTKEYLLGYIICFAIGLQTLLFFTSAYYLNIPEPPHTDPVHKMINSVLYIGLLGLKLFQIYPYHIFTVLLSCLVIAGLGFVAIRTIGLIRTGLLGLTLLLAAYTAIYAPDSSPVSIINASPAIWADEYKLQREVIINILLLILIFIGLGSLYQFALRSKRRPQIFALIFVLIAVMAITQYRPIHARTADVYVNIDPFRSSLRVETPICMPIAPTPLWAHDVPSNTVYGWYYESRPYGLCGKTNYDKSINYSSFDNRIGKGLNISVEPLENQKLATLYILVATPTPQKTRTLVVQDTTTKKEYSAEIVTADNGEAWSFVAFNMSDETPQSVYNLTLKEAGEKNSLIRTGTFTNGDLAYYGYFLPAK